MTESVAHVVEVSGHSKDHQQIRFTVGVPGNCVHMEVMLGELVESISRPNPSAEVMEFVRVIPTEFRLSPGDRIRVRFFEFGEQPTS